LSFFAAYSPRASFMASLRPNIILAFAISVTPDLSSSGTGGQSSSD
jgi:hypothetical protein